MLHSHRGKGKPRPSQAIGVWELDSSRRGTSNSAEALPWHKSAAVVQTLRREKWSPGCKSFCCSSFAATAAGVSGSAVLATEASVTAVVHVVSGLADGNAVNTTALTSKAWRDDWTTATDNGITCSAESWFEQGHHQEK